MSPLRRQLARVTTWFDERPIRERGLILVTVLALIALTGWELWAGPAMDRVSRLQGELAGVRSEQASLQSREAELEQLLQQDPSAELRQTLAARQRRLEQLDRQITETTGQLIPPRAMVVMLQDMLATEEDLELVGVRLLAPEAIFAEEDDARGQENPEALMYAHEADITVRGGYLKVLNYLQRLESLDERLGWVLLEYEAGEWPRGTARVRVRTLSLEPAWLGV
ncbi:MSHA biogenesis protein MshJ [Marinobacter daqiaonensis]|uniref:MSHA biogenesis protein MshJ n=1 Tax=Marinobacter daqiaonensis TaxID=650891 RepID=A0A1I6K145_9GAMM|nr:type II secretion system protein M [Marinobacter daqiaonensis]SFR84936.1 MSHA biogenesis protein MshJ [Marinobacter daqiaonensis]